MTPAELASAVEGANAAEEALWWREAWFTAQLLLPHNRDKRGRCKPIKVESLLPDVFKPSRRRVPMTKKEAQAEAKRIREEIETEREKAK